MDAEPAGSHGTLLWSGQLGRLRAELCQVGDDRMLTVGERRIVVKPDAVVRHRIGWLGQRLTIEQPGEAPFTHRYRLPWASQLAPLWEATYDRWSAEADDPGLVLTELLGGIDDWREVRSMILSRGMPCLRSESSSEASSCPSVEQRA